MPANDRVDARRVLLVGLINMTEQMSTFNEESGGRPTSPRYSLNLSNVVRAAATLLFLVTEAIAIAVLARYRSSSFNGSLVASLVPVLAAVPWLAGVLAHLRVQKIVAPPQLREETVDRLTALVANMVAASYCALLPCELLLVNLLPR